MVEISFGSGGDREAGFNMDVDILREREGICFTTSGTRRKSLVL